MAVSSLATFLSCTAPSTSTQVVGVELFAASTFRFTFRGLLADQNIVAMTSAVTGGITATMTAIRAGQSGATTVNAGAELQVQGGLRQTTAGCEGYRLGSSARERLSRR